MLPVGITGASPRVTVVAAAEAGTAIDRPVTTRSDRLSSAALPERSRLLQWRLGQLFLACTETRRTATRTREWLFPPMAPSLVRSVKLMAFLLGRCRVRLISRAGRERYRAGSARRTTIGSRVCDGLHAGSIDGASATHDSCVTDDVTRARVTLEANFRSDSLPSLSMRLTLWHLKDACMVLRDRIRCRLKAVSGDAGGNKRHPAGQGTRRAVET